MGKIDKSYYFNGASSSLSKDMSYTLAHNKPLSISLWYNSQSFSNDKNVLAYGSDSQGDFQIEILEKTAGGNHLHVGVVEDGVAWRGTIDSSVAISNNTWYLINVNYYANKTLEIYINGANRQTVTTSSSATGSGRMRVGVGIYLGATATNFILAKIDEIGIWNRTLTQTEITALYNSGVGSRYTTTTTFTNTYSAGDVVDWNMKFCDSDGDCGQAVSNYRFTVDEGAPTIALNYPTSLIDYGKINETLQLNFTATDANLDLCGYSYYPRDKGTKGGFGGTTYYNSTNNTIAELYSVLIPSGYSYVRTVSLPSGCSVNGKIVLDQNDTDVYCVGTSNLSLGSRITRLNARIFDILPSCSSGVENLRNITLGYGSDVTIYANDTAGNLATEVFGWDYKVFENSRTFTTPIVETSLDTFVINVTADVSLSSVYLNYNGTEYSTSLSGGVYTKQLNIPAVTEESIVPVYWRFVYAGTNITSDITNQTISKLVFNICNATINQTLINFTTKSATNPFPVVNSTFKSSWMLSASVRATPTNFTYEDIDGNKSSYAFCTNTNATTIYTDADIEYDGANYAFNFYYLEDVNLTATNPQNISLYLLNDSLAAVTILKVVSASQQPQAEHQINIQSYDVGTGTFYLVGMAKTNFNGEDVVYLNWYDTLYKFIVLDENGDVVKTTGTTKISLSPTTIELENEITFPYDKFEDFVYSLYYENSTSNFVLTYTKPSGEVDEACLRVYKHGQGNDTLVCDECETSASATMFCNVASYGNGTYVALFYATGSFSLVDWIYEYVGGTFQTTIYNLLGNEDASFYAFLFAGLITVALFINAVFGIIALMIGLIGASALGFTALQWGQMTGVIIIGGFIIWILKR